MQKDDKKVKEPYEKPELKKEGELKSITAQLISPPTD
jgi:hypothetical protein